jgi:hypothetical protein
MNDLIVLEAVISALTKIASDSNMTIKTQVWDFTKYLIADIHLQKYHEMEQKILSERIYQLSRVVNIDYDFYGWRRFQKIENETQ